MGIVRFEQELGSFSYGRLQHNVSSGGQVPDTERSRPQGHPGKKDLRATSHIDLLALPIWGGVHALRLDSTP